MSIGMTPEGYEGDYEMTWRDLVEDDIGEVEEYIFQLPVYNNKQLIHFPPRPSQVTDKKDSNGPQLSFNDQAINLDPSGST